jgi:hypothetical protein
VGSPAAGKGGATNWWNTTNEGAKWFDEDAFLAQLVFFHPKNDTVGRYKWWGDRAADAGFDYGADALTAYGFRVRNSAFSTMRLWDVSASRTFVAGPNGISVLDTLDCGTGLQEPAALAAQACADQLVLVTDAKPSTASEAAALLRTVGPPLTLVVNRMPAKGAEIDLDGLDALIADAQGLVCVSEDQQGATRVASGDFSWDDAPAAWDRQIRELAVVLQADWPGLGLAG